MGSADLAHRFTPVGSTLEEQSETGSHSGVRVTTSQFLCSLVLFLSFLFRVFVLHYSTLFRKASITDALEEDVLRKMSFSGDDAAAITPSTLYLPLRGRNAHVWVRDVPRAQASETYDVHRLDNSGLDVLDVGVDLSVPS